MPSSADPTAPGDRTAQPIYLELAPAPGTAPAVEHLFVFRDRAVLSGPGRGRFATDLFTLSVTTRDGPERAVPQVRLAPPRPCFVPRKTAFRGIIAGLRLRAAPERLPSVQSLIGLYRLLDQARAGDDALPLLVAALDTLAGDLRFAPRPPVRSDRTGRRRARADTGMSLRRLGATRRFRHLLQSLAGEAAIPAPSRHRVPARPLADLALEAGYHDQPHMSAACRSFAGIAAGALRRQIMRAPDGPFLQDPVLKDRLRLVIMDQTKE